MNQYNYGTMTMLDRQRYNERQEAISRETQSLWGPMNQNDIGTMLGRQMYNGQQTMQSQSLWGPLFGGPASYLYLEERAANIRKYRRENAIQRIKAQPFFIARSKS